MVLILIIILVVLALGAWPSFGYHQWGYGPSGIVGILLIVLVILLLTGRL